MSSDQYLTLDGVRLRYRDEGAGPAVVLLHGWTLDLEMWEPQVEGLRERFRLLRFDRRGFGLSSGAPDIAADATDARCLCHHVGIRRAAFVGMSQGARILERLILDSPTLLACVVFDGAPDMRPGGTLTNADIPFAQLSELAKAQGLAAFRAAWAEHPLSKLLTADAGMHALLGKILDRYPGTDLLAPGPGTPMAPFVPEQVRIPAIVLNGELDLPSRRHAGDLLARALPVAERILIPQAGHIANLDNPRDYNDALVRFISAATAPSACQPPPSAR